MSAAGLAFAAATALVFGALDLAPSAGRIRGPLRSASDAFTRVGQEGRDPGAVERRQLLVLAALAAFAAGWFVLGLRAAVLGAAVAPAIGSRVLRARRERYTRAVDAGAA